MHPANSSKEILDAFLNLGSRIERTLGASTGGGTPMHGSQSCAGGGADADDGAQGVARATGRGDPWFRGGTVDVREWERLFDHLSGGGRVGDREH